MDKNNTPVPCPCLEAHHLHTYYGLSLILKDVSFHINHGESIALLGRNGMGKTTFIKTIIGLVRAQQGSIWWRGQDITKTPTHNIMQNGIAYVPEGRGIFPNLSVYENMVMSSRLRDSGIDEALPIWTQERVLTLFPRLAERLKHMGHQLSGGEQQMLSIARALMTQPTLLILDEATEGLAPSLAQEMWRVIEQISQEGIATLIVDKNHQALTKITQRTLIMVKGRFVFDGLSATVRHNFSAVEHHLSV